LQVNNTNFNNIDYYNNTFVHRPGSPHEGILWIIFDGTSSDWTGGYLASNAVHLTNNLFVFDNVVPYKELIDEAFDPLTNLIIRTETEDPGIYDISGVRATDFDLVEGSPAIDVGTVVPGGTLDFLNRTIPAPGGTVDVGAYEYGATQEVCLPSRSPL